VTAALGRVNVGIAAVVAAPSRQIGW